MILNEIASHHVLTLAPVEPIARALVVMQEEGIQHLPVVRGRKPLGMVSDHDVLEHVGWNQVVGRRAAASTWRVEKIMKSPMISLSPDDSLRAATQLMLKKHIGALPLVAEDRLVGIVTESDFWRFLIEPNGVIADEHRQLPCEECMTKDPLTAEPNDDTLDVYRLMRTRRIRHLPVLEHEHLVGILSDRDVLRGAPSQETGSMVPGRPSALHSPLKVRGIMNREVTTLAPNEPIAEAARKMLECKIGAVLIVEPDEEKLVGILTETDLLRVFVDHCADG